MILDEFTIDVPAVIEKRRTLIEETAGIGADELPALTRELYDRLDALTADIDDAAVLFVPDDPAAEADAAGWTLGHVVVHLTAGLEENAAQGCTLARGAEISGRPRYETPWEDVTAAAQVRQRLAESRHMTLAFLDAWPDAPHLANTHEHAFFGPVNAVAYHALGIAHATEHFAQLEEIQRQAAATVR
ncbi:MAG: DinB family protein [Chloroflexia bacterium]|nr:DinB family protein [Chloroflexia bacterium]